MISPAAEDYLKIIYKLGIDGAAVSTNAIALEIAVSQASVTGMLKRLSEMRLISYVPYHGVELTESGRKVALEIIRHHRLLELYLAEALGYTWDKVHDEAEKLEHVISEEFEDKMADALGHPTIDPHGAPIPSKEGVMENRGSVPLSSVDVGETVRVEQVSDNDPEMLRYLAKLGIYPEVELDVIEKAPFGGPLEVRIGRDRHHLGTKLTDQIFIARS